ncbi:MAG: hypothetical protein AVDCRST_MAG77-4964 [uncultured Chloroflexi bacterium]|uniref:Uncharacterized protein n=1 Tax=uncultured Chloroflexota bacterium TaxID=166587 RepID=A0A6J4K250_9CHLR|nr:MAG: hypothetical protein AVDCRST_MAG77-4964 [uncultured Chloroflexota bacterium]
MGEFLAHSGMVLPVTLFLGVILIVTLALVTRRGA